MDYSTGRPGGQPHISSDLLPLVHQLCDFMQMLRAWWEHFEVAIRKVDRAAAIKAYDLMIEGVITARQIARALGFELPPVDTLNWTVAPKQYRPPAEL
jgi:hypothetical protein